MGNPCWISTAASTPTWSGRPRRTRCRSAASDSRSANPGRSPPRGFGFHRCRCNDSIRATTGWPRRVTGIAPASLPPTLPSTTTAWSSNMASTGRRWLRAAASPSGLRQQPVLLEEEPALPEQKVEAAGDHRPRNQGEDQGGKRIPSQKSDCGQGKRGQTNGAKDTTAGISPGLSRPLLLFDQRERRRQYRRKGQEQASGLRAKSRADYGGHQCDAGSEDEAEADLGGLRLEQVRPIEPDRLLILFEKHAALQRHS